MTEQMNESRIGTQIEPRLYDQIERLPVDNLVPYARNARTHDVEQIAQIAASIREFGFTNPVLVDESGGIIAGHGRVLAARTLQLNVVPCLRLAGLTVAQRRAYILADNQIALNAGWDLELLADELQHLRDDGYELDLIGFDTDFMADLLADPVPEKDPDDAPALPVEPVSVLGDIWILGLHRLACGDSTAPANLQALMQGELADACWTDPPYNVAYGACAEFQNKGKNGNKTGNKTGKQRNTDRILNDDLDDASFREFLGGFYRTAWGVMKPGAAIYVAHSETERHNFTEQFLQNGFKLSGCLIWRKNALVLGRSDYQWMHEPILYGWKPGAAHRWYGGRKKTTVQHLEGSPFTRRPDGLWEIQLGTSVLVVEGEARIEELLPDVITEDKPLRNDIHPTMKPVALIERMLVNSAKRGEIVLDPFGGSGSTLMACERLGMKARLSELSPGYVDVIIRRWQQFTNMRAILESSGQPFPE
ncbi:site-specific DNA-methyltransferase [Candidatus Nitrotoga sp. M5]|uniref:site-specific DNA-methyltransferase n=1 Tax=Candidatus Nitrotoga sp. M5 TaxID=2890409 RepID=UPI001EF48691|nr:site-specific DNA-methyltransferase [Candidatus Nitrotoga sp. M5]CAH1387977.1 Site-specific DNA-methyltransferase (adenine-specific) [Candidatus Nitrotoga sp. M5]